MSARDRFVGVALRVFARLPRRVRRSVVRVGAPSFYVGAIGAVVVDDAVLLVRQTYRAGFGLPGGLLGRDEEPEAAVIREIYEEAGLAVVTVGPPAVVVEARTHRIDLCFRCVPAPGIDPASARASSPEIRETRWVPLAEVDGLQPEAIRGLQVLGYEVSSRAGLSRQPRRTRP